MTRTCGTCTLCCRLLPVSEIGKKANTLCPAQTATGCGCYAKRPFSCKTWSCRWLEGDDVGERPDSSHFVVDSYPDMVTINDTPILAIQVWVDPDYTQAHKDTHLRAFIERRSQVVPCVAIIRYSDRAGFVLIPPLLSPTGDWIAETGTVVEREEFYGPGKLPSTATPADALGGTDGP